MTAVPPFCFAPVVVLPDGLLLLQPAATSATAATAAAAGSSRRPRRGAGLVRRLGPAVSCDRFMGSVLIPALRGGQARIPAALLGPLRCGPVSRPALPKTTADAARESGGRRPNLSPLSWRPLGVYLAAEVTALRRLPYGGEIGRRKTGSAAGRAGVDRGGRDRARTFS